VNADFQRLGLARIKRLRIQLTELVHGLAVGVSVSVGFCSVISDPAMSLSGAG
jgi:hypothetical protein